MLRREHRQRTGQGGKTTTQRASHIETVMLQNETCRQHRSGASEKPASSLRVQRITSENKNKREEQGIIARHDNLEADK